MKKETGFVIFSVAIGLIELSGTIKHCVDSKRKRRESDKELERELHDAEEAIKAEKERHEEKMKQMKEDFDEEMRIRKEEQEKEYQRLYRLKEEVEKVVSEAEKTLSEL